jgi:hypothetical protein
MTDKPDDRYFPQFAQRDVEKLYSTVVVMVLRL